MPGDLAPFGKVFDFVEVAWINDLGDVGFGAHVQGEEFLQDNVYLSKAPSFQIISIAHQGEPAPGGGMFRHAMGADPQQLSSSSLCRGFNPCTGPARQLTRALSLQWLLYSSSGASQRYPSGWKDENGK